MKCIIDIWKYKHRPTHTVVEEEELIDHLQKLVASSHEGISIFVWKENLKKQWALFKHIEFGRQPIHVRRPFGAGVDYSVNDVI